MIRGLTNYAVIAPFAGAALIKNVVTDRIVVFIENISKKRLVHWTPQNLRRYMPVDITAVSSCSLDYRLSPVYDARQLFYGGVPDSTRLDAASHIHVEAEFVRISQTGCYNGKVVYRRVT